MIDKKVMIVGAGVAAVGLLGLLSQFKQTEGVVSAVGEGIGEAVGSGAVAVVSGAAAGVAKGVAGGVSKVIGIRTPGQTITDPYECKAYIDENGWLDGSQACSLPAYWQAMKM